MPQIGKMPEAKFEGKNVENMMYVDYSNTPPQVRAIKLRSVFEWIAIQAVETGLTVEFRGNDIIFIKE